MAGRGEFMSPQECVGRGEYIRHHQGLCWSVVGEYLLLPKIVEAGWVEEGRTAAAWGQAVSQLGGECAAWSHMCPCKLVVAGQGGK